VTASAALGPDARRQAGLAGGLYVVIIAAGLWGEAFVRAPLLIPGDPAATAQAVQAAAGLVRASLATDLLMLIADVGLAVLLYRLLRAQGPGLAMAALAFRLMQAAALAANLLQLQRMLLLLEGGRSAIGLDDHAAAWITLHLQAHAHGYDLGLAFFGLNALLTGTLLWRAAWVPRALAGSMMAAGGVYLVGSGLRLLMPGLSDAFAPVYAVPLLAESAWCGWLLWVGTCTRWQAGLTRSPSRAGRNEPDGPR
jgi:hypothetical protein